MTHFSSVLIGNESLLIQCGRILLDKGHVIAAVVTRNPDVRDWAKDQGLTVTHPGKDLATRLPQRFDWLLSIANLDIIPAEVLALPTNGAVNFHDGPLPRYAGLNAPVWAIANQEPTHGITWHMIEGGIDEGDILSQHPFKIGATDTALTLNTRCYEAAIDSFAGLADQLATGAPVRHPQDLAQRSYFGMSHRPAAAARLDFMQPATRLAALVRALDHGDYWNPLCCPKIEVDGDILLVGKAEVVTGQGQPGDVLACDDSHVTVATGAGAVQLGTVRRLDGRVVTPAEVFTVGQTLPSASPALAASIETALAPSQRAERRQRSLFETLTPARMGPADVNPSEKGTRSVTLGCTPDAAAAGLALMAARLGDGDHIDLAYDHHLIGQTAPYLLSWSPLRMSRTGDVAAVRRAFATTLEETRQQGPVAADLPARLAGRLDGRPVFAMPDLALTDSDHMVVGALITLSLSDRPILLAPAQNVTDEMLAIVAARVEHLASVTTGTVADLDLMTQAERQLVLRGWNDTAVDFDADLCVHHGFERQVAQTPNDIALVIDDESLTYLELNARANQVAHVLRDMGVKPGVLVGLNTQRSAHLLIGALGVFKAGGAYVPLDPAYPADRVALYIEDSGCQVIATQQSMAADLPDHSAAVLALDSDPRILSAPTDNLDVAMSGDDMAYMIYTSGSTGRPKGVMVEHRNVSNFFTGMDDRIDHSSGSVWLAVTSLSFDISVLELFYTLSRGFKLVLSSDENRTMVSGQRIQQTSKGMDFSLFYWGNDDGVGRDKYELLLEGAKFADANGFCAIWTPERHFHAFGGPYPNPSVTGAAVAALTKNIAVRAGSCVAPLHHPARVAEEWAVIDNLTNGRTGLGIASGWQPHDFVLRPENTPPNNKPAMLKTIEQLRALWRGEEVEFPMADGSMHGVVTQPRPVSKKLEVWVTTAGNPETWKEAGRIGANVLTHLLGQSIDEVGDKIKIYHQALRDAGHDPKDFTVTLMLHTFVAEDRDTAREIAREPMKDYLRSAAGLIKQFAWAFPAFKRPEGVKNAFDLDLGGLQGEEMEAILDFAFQRYFEDSGLFGTVEDCLDRVEDLKRIGVDEIACLIDYGIDKQTVLNGLSQLGKVREASNSGAEVAEDDFSIAAQIVRHGVTHLQCTPSMARMISLSDEAKLALGRVKHLMIGGEALPGDLVAEFAKITDAGVENMYGPTETTIWSTTETAAAQEATVNIGRPIANTQVYVLDDQMQPVPIGVAGELYIGGAGVTRGYWQRDDLTADRFLADPHLPGNRIYRTGDLARWRGDGKLDFLGRADHQVKLRGYRIELGEIEAAMTGHPAITQAVVIPREDMPGDTRLVAYMLADAPVADAALRQHLLQSLPEFMVPSAFVTMDSFPLTPNKKIDRKALPKPQPKNLAKPQRNSQPKSRAGDRSQAAAGQVGSQASADVQQQVATIWSEILGVQDIGPKDNFFDLGGHSLLAVQAHREIRTRLGAKDLGITDIFRFPVLSALCDKVAQSLGSESQADTPPVRPTQPAPATSARADAMSRRKEMRARRMARTKS